MATDAKAELRELVEHLPDDPEILGKIRDTIKDAVVRELELREGIHEALARRGRVADEGSAAIGATFSIRRRDEDDPILRAFLDAPEDDEPLTDADRAAIAEGKADAERGDVVPWEDYSPDRQVRT